jgi:hypothetical protein
VLGEAAGRTRGRDAGGGRGRQRGELRPVDPASYRELAPGQKIVVPGAKGSVDENDEVCATAGDGSLTCEIQNPGEAWGQDKKTHGFVLSAQGSRVY